MRTAGFAVDRLLEPEAALAAYFERAALAAPRVERVALEAAFDRVLAVDVVAPEDLPVHPRSTMDGFAVASASTQRTRRVVGEVAMGRAAPHGIALDETMHIPTGGALPDGADAVVPIEVVDDLGETIELRVPVAAGDALTQRGDDVRGGERVLEAGRRIGGPELGVLATLGYERVEVFVRPRIGVVSTGDELVAVGVRPGAGQVRDSNSYGIAAALRALGVDAFRAGHSADDPAALRSALASALETCDGIVLTGGSSVGARDFTPRVVAELGEPGPIVHGLRVKPGKPTVLAAVGGKPVVGLPGNPASSLMILEAVARPIFAVLTGWRDDGPAAVDALASVPFEGRAGWTWYVPARIVVRDGTPHAMPLPIRSSHTSLLARAAGYVTLREGGPRIEAGERVRVARFSLGGASFEHAR